MVIKQISVQQMSNEEKEVSLNEAKVLAMLRHPNIIAYYHSFLEEKSLAIVMEYAPGKGTRAVFTFELNSFCLECLKITT